MIGVLFQQFFALLTEGRPPGQRTSLSHAASSKKMLLFCIQCAGRARFCLFVVGAFDLSHVIVGLFFFQFLSFCLLLCFFVSFVVSLFACLFLCLFASLFLCFCPIFLLFSLLCFSACYFVSAFS